MAPLLVRIVQAALRAASHTALFLEAQRLALHFLRPTSPRHLAAAEAVLLSTVSSPVRHDFVPAPTLQLHTICVGNQKDPPIVLLHGHSMSAAFYFRNFDDFVRIGLRVYAVDLLGWGRSARPIFQGITTDDTIQWYLSSLIAWVNSMRLEPFILMGHSLGAYLAFEYAKRCPDMVSKLVLISPAAISRSLSLPRAMYFALPPQSIVRRGGLLGFLFFMLKYPRTPCYVGDRLREYTYHLAAQRPPSGEVAIIPIIKFHGIAEASCTRPMIEALQSVPMPVQIVCGETDSSIDIQDVHLLYREMKHRGFDVRIAVIDGTDHCPHLESPDDFFAAIAGFLNPGKQHKAADLSSSASFDSTESNYKRRLRQSFAAMNRRRSAISSPFGELEDAGA